MREAGCYRLPARGYLFLPPFLSGACVSTDPASFFACAGVALPVLRTLPAILAILGELFSFRATLFTLPSTPDTGDGNTNPAGLLGPSATRPP